MKFYKISALFIRSILCSSLFLFSSAAYADGEMDSSFGVGGIVTQDFHGDDELVSAKILRDGKYLVLGHTERNDASPNPTEYFNILARYNASDGSPDGGFGDSGSVIFPIYSPVSGYYADNLSLAVEPDGKIIVAGMIRIRDDQWSFVLARFNANGAPDIGFGPDRTGKIIYNNLRLIESNGIEVLCDGSILAVGSMDNSSLVLYKFRSDGSVDTSFGLGRGFSSISSTDSSFSVWGSSLAIQADGKIVVVGAVGPTYTDELFHPLLARFSSEGVLDSTFNSTGSLGAGVIVDNNLGRFTKVNIQNGGKIVAVGRAVTNRAGPDQYYTTRFNSDGSLDSTFGSRRDGKEFYLFRGSTHGFASDFVIQSDGKIIVGGENGVDTSHGIMNETGLIRYNYDGTLDTSFSSNQLLSQFMSENSSDPSLLLQDGKVLIAGKTGVPGDFALARMNISAGGPSGALNPLFCPASSSHVSADTGYSPSATSVSDHSVHVVAYPQYSPMISIFYAHLSSLQGADKSSLEISKQHDMELLKELNTGGGAKLTPYKIFEILKKSNPSTPPEEVMKILSPTLTPKELHSLHLEYRASTYQAQDTVGIPTNTEENLSKFPKLVSDGDATLPMPVSKEKQDQGKVEAGKAATVNTMPKPEAKSTWQNLMEFFGGGSK